MTGGRSLGANTGEVSMQHRRFVRFGVLTTAVTILLVAGVSSPSSAQSPTPEAYMELLRSDVRTAKVEILTDALALSATQGEAFWPIYREYGTELAKLGDRRIAMIKAFAETYGSTTDEQATLFAKDWFALQSGRLKLRKKYFDRVSKAVSPLVAAQFMQVENVAGMLIDIQIAAELPLME